VWGYVGSFGPFVSMGPKVGCEMLVAFAYAYVGSEGVSGQAGS
jgi:hypothetical protein